jgi:hypothetical protein
MKGLVAWVVLLVGGLLALVGAKRLRRRDVSAADESPAARTRTSRSPLSFGPPWG